MEIPKIREKAKISLISTFLTKKLKRKIEAIKIITKITNLKVNLSSSFWEEDFFKIFSAISPIFPNLISFSVFSIKISAHLLPLEFLQKLHLPHFFELALIPPVKICSSTKKFKQFITFPSAGINSPLIK